MATAWRRGERLPAEEFLARHPELADDADGALRLVYEEICLREERGEEIKTAEVLGRFPRWHAELEVFLACHQLLQSGTGVTFSEAEEVLTEFRLLAEIGRGAMGRVYLATQPALADRPVVLKVTPCVGREHLSLARLQHTHIVPLYWVQDVASSGLRILCMPYLGGATLEQLLEVLSGRPAEQRTGQHLLDGIAKAQKPVPVELATQGPIREFLSRVSYVEAVCWVGICLAEALHYAHERGLVHLDIKPSNVLLAADGQPFVLDFHLARPPLRPDEPVPEWFGGTPGCMSPEQRQAMAAAHERRPSPVAIDRRSDIYSLGLLLYEALGGARAGAGSISSPGGPANGPATTVSCLEPVTHLFSRFARKSSPLPRLGRINPQVSTGLADIIEKCLSDDPRDRYPDAAALAADLRRHRTNQPLRGVANRSLMERWRKWRRRRPSALSLLGMFAAVVAAVALVVAGQGHRVRDSRDEAEAALATGKEQLKQLRYAEAVHTLTRGQAAAERLPAARELSGALGHQLRRARRAEMADKLHRTVDAIRFLSCLDVPAEREARPVEARCRALWDARGWIAETEDAALEPEVEQQIRTDLRELAILWSALRVRLAPNSEGHQARREALGVLAGAEAITGPSLVLHRERQAYAEALGFAEEGRAAARRAHEMEPQTAWEHYAVGRIHLRFASTATPASVVAAAGGPDAPLGAGPFTGTRALLAAQNLSLMLAAVEFERALDLRPDDLWANFYQGLCAYRMERHAEAVKAFHACVALAPRNAECYYNRAMAYGALGQTDHAIRDYDQALRLSPQLAAAALNRGMLHYREKRYSEAVADLRRALDQGADPAMTHYNLALVYLAQGNRTLAHESLQQALRQDPTHGPAQSLRGRLGAKR